MSTPYAPDALHNPGSLDRDRAFEADGADSNYLYCIHCERAYERGYYRQVGDLQMCPYADCDGDAVIDAWPWDQIADNANAAYPAVPVLGKVYPMYGEK